jgi:hypothetical protein
VSSRFIAFGAQGTNIEYVAQLIGEALGVDLSLRESSFKGGEYFFIRTGEGMEISVEQHARDEEGEYAESGFSNYGILVYFNYAPSGMEERGAALSGLRLLRVETL